MGTSSRYEGASFGGLGTIGDSASHSPKMLGFSREPASQGLFVCLDSPLKSLLAEVAALGSFSIFKFSILPQWSRSKWWSSFSRSVSHYISPGVNELEVSFFSQVLSF